jgi:hypothetical protein
MWEYRCFVRQPDGDEAAAALTCAALRAVARCCVGAAPAVAPDAPAEQRTDRYFVADDDTGLKQRGSTAGAGAVEALELKCVTKRDAGGAEKLLPTRLMPDGAGSWVTADGTQLPVDVAAKVDAALARPPLAVAKKRRQAASAEGALLYEVTELSVRVGSQAQRWLSVCVEGPQRAAVSAAGAQLAATLRDEVGPAMLPRAALRVAGYAAWVRALAAAAATTTTQIDAAE